MNRKSLREFSHRAGQFLTLANSTYKQWVFRFTILELEKDLGLLGDITTAAVFPGKQMVRGKIVARESGILCGIEEIRYFLVESDAAFKPRVGEFKVDFKFKDGDLLSAGDVVMEIEAEVHDLLAVERVVLNLLSRMSGVASFTRSVAEKAGDVMVAATRKTLWGWLDKKAVLIGGGGTHRMNLADSVIVKDTHLDNVGRDFTLVMGRLLDAELDCRFVEIEVESVDEVRRCVEAFERAFELGLKSVGVVMMDNMSPAEIADAMARVNSEKILFEASGGITEKNVADYAATGVDIVSMGCLTGGVKGMDFGMKVG